MYFTHFVVDAGVIQDPLGRSGLAGIDVRHDADIPNVLKRCCACHGSSRRPR